MLQQALGVLLASAWVLAAACTNEYDELAYLPEDAPSEGPGPTQDSCDGPWDCDGAEQCDQGRCSCAGEPACSTGETCCPFQGCRNLDVDPEHCGGCGDDCPGNFRCDDGACVP